MPKTVSERTLKMMQDYLSLHQQGLTPIDIAKRYHLSSRTIYNYLDQIAEANHVSRESLLKVPHAQHPPHLGLTTKVIPLDPDQFHIQAAAALAELDLMIEIIAQQIATQLTV